MHDPEFSFIVPIYQDAYLSEDFCANLQSVFRQYLSVDDVSSCIELIFVIDSPWDNSFDTLRQISEKYLFVKIVRLSRNFGQHIAVSCGYKYARGQYVGTLNVDMQDPPSEIPKLLERMKQGDVDIAIGVRNCYCGSWSNRFTSISFNFVLNKLTGQNIPLQASTLRIMNRKFVDAYNTLSEKSRFLPGLETWLGFRRAYVEIAQQKRAEGKSSYNLKKRLSMAFDSIISFSDLPLKIAVVFGFLIGAIGLLLTLILVVQKLFFINLQPGYTSVVSLIIFLGGFQIFMIGVASVYIGRILREVQNRPLYIVRDTYKIG